MAEVTQSLPLEITIEGGQGNGKTTAFELICKAFQKEGAVVIDLHPIPELGMEDRALICYQGVKISLNTKQKEAVDV